MTTRAHVEHRVRQIIVELGGIPAERVPGHVQLVDDLDMDSLDAIELAIELERQLGVAVTHDSLACLGTVSEVVDLVCGRLGLMPAWAAPVDADAHSQPRPGGHR